MSGLTNFCLHRVPQLTGSWFSMFRSLPSTVSLISKLSFLPCFSCFDSVTLMSSIYVLFSLLLLDSLSFCSAFKLPWTWDFLSSSSDFLSKQLDGKGFLTIVEGTLIQRLSLHSCGLQARIKGIPTKGLFCH